MKKRREIGGLLLSYCLRSFRMEFGEAVESQQSAVGCSGVQWQLRYCQLSRLCAVFQTKLAAQLTAVTFSAYQKTQQVNCTLDNDSHYGDITNI